MALILLLAPVSFTQEFGQSVTPSEDELWEAFLLGEIDYRQYLILQEIIVHGIDSTNNHLLDEIPNLSFFLTVPKSLTTSLEKEQKAAFSKLTDQIGRATGTFGYRYYQELEQEGRASYRSSGHIHFGDHFETAFKLNREYSGRERFVSRGLSYKNAGSLFNEVRLGSFSQRLGLGTIFGYRGKLLGFSDRIDRESLLFPDYGGYNGAYARMKLDRLELEALGSVNRDVDRTHVAAGAMVTLNGKAFQPSVIVGLNRIKNRRTGERLADFKYGINSLYRYQDGYFSFEFCAQAGERPSWGGFVAEGRHHFGRAEIKYAGWVYDDSYLDLTGGSKAGNLSRPVTLDKVDFTYSDKRSGQEGGMLKSIVLLTKDIEMVSSLVYAGRNRDTVDFQFLSGLVKKLNRRLEVRLDHLSKTKRRLYGGDVRVEIDQRTRVETRIKADNLSARSYIGYNTKSGRRDHVSVFMNLKYRSTEVGSVEIWSDLARFDLKRAAVDYWYVFVKSAQEIFDGLTAAVKLSHRYHRGSVEKHYSVVLLEVYAVL